VNPRHDAKTDKNANLAPYKPSTAFQGEGGRKSTLQKFSKDVFIEFLEIIDWNESEKHVEYIIKVRGRTKYLVNLKDLAENGLID